MSMKDKLTVDLTTTHKLKEKTDYTPPDMSIKKDSFYADLEAGMNDDSTLDWGLMNDFLAVYDKGNTNTNALRWGFYSLLALIKGRDVWLNFGSRPLFPNLYVGLVGAPSCGKSTAITVVKDLAKELGYPSFAPEIINPSKLFHYFQEHYKNGMIDSMGNNPLVEDMFAMEKQNFLSDDFKSTADPLTIFNVNNRYTQGKSTQKLRLLSLDHDALGLWSSEFLGTIPPTSKWLVAKVLTELYDSQDFTTYSPDEGIVLKQPIINLLGGVTTSGLARSFGVEDFSNGMLTRMVLVNLKNVDKANPFGQSHDFTGSTQLIEDLGDVYDMTGEIKVSDKAQALFNRISNFQFNVEYDIRLAFYYNRRSLILIKMAMLTAMMHKRMTVTENDVKIANTLLMYSEFDMPETLVDFATTVPIKIRNVIISYLETRLRTKEETTSEMIIKNVSQRLGVSTEKPILLELKKLIDNRVIMVLPMKDHNSYSLQKPKNVDILSAIEYDFVNIGVIPEWNINDYAGGDRDLEDMVDEDRRNSMLDLEL